ncbi:MAG: polyprenyl synthetase family protein [Ignavibacteriaceae bacterium]|nr:polyprenyl synthetase family protein [Ignavibacteriaceae bacterium]
MKEYKKLYNSQRKIVEEKISKIFVAREPRSLYEPSAYLLKSGGKRLRPLLVLLSAKAVGAKFSSAYNAALAVELLHNFTLVHDDIMDNADKRRGRLTLHKKYDTNTAIIAGDSLLSIAYEFLLKDCNGNAKKILETFNRGLIEVCEGQSLDKEFETRNKVTLNEYLEMIRKKTAAMAEMCCSVGAQLAGGSKSEIKALEDYGRNIGIAFQIQDDLLDITADEAEFGKVVGGDLIEGKKTFLFIKAFEKAKNDDKRALFEVVLNKGIKKHQVEEYKQIYERLGVLTDAKNSISKYTEAAVCSLKKLPRKEDIEIFQWIAYSLIERIK